MKETQKILICNGYDTILNNIPRIPDAGESELVSTEKVIGNNIFKVQHNAILYSLAAQAHSKMECGPSINEFIVYINQPDFDVKRFYPINLSENGAISIEQSFIIGEEEQQVIIDRKQKVHMFRKQTKLPLIPITHVSKVQLAEGLYYFNEEIVFINEYQFNQLVYFVKDRISVETGLPIIDIEENQRFKVSLWEVLSKRKDTKYCTVPSGYYESLDKFKEAFNKCHDGLLQDNEWYGKHFVYYDNRGCFPETTRTMPLVKQMVKLD